MLIQTGNKNTKLDQLQTNLESMQANLLQSRMETPQEHYRRWLFKQQSQALLAIYKSKKTRQLWSSTIEMQGLTLMCC